MAGMKVPRLPRLPRAAHPAIASSNDVSNPYTPLLQRDTSSRSRCQMVCNHFPTLAGLLLEDPQLEDEPVRPPPVLKHNSPPSFKGFLTEKDRAEQEDVENELHDTNSGDIWKPKTLPKSASGEQKLSHPLLVLFSRVAVRCSRTQHSARCSCCCLSSTSFLHLHKTGCVNLQERR